MRSTARIALLPSTSHNNLASICNHSSGWARFYGPTFEELWSAYAEEVIKTTDLFPGHIPFIFDLWFQYKDFRRMLSCRLDLEHTDTGLNAVYAHRKKSSSFEYDAHLKKGQDLQVLDRYQHFMGNEWYREWLGSTTDLWRKVMWGAGEGTQKTHSNL